MIGLKLKRKIRIPGRGYVSGDIVTDKRTAAYLIAMSAAVEDEMLPVETAEEVEAVEAVEAVDATDAVDPIDTVAAVEVVDVVEAVEAVDAVDPIESVAAVEVVEPPVRRAGRPRKNREAE